MLDCFIDAVVCSAPSRKWLLWQLSCRLELPDLIQHITWTRPYRPTETPASTNITKTPSVDSEGLDTRLCQSEQFKIHFVTS